MSSKKNVHQKQKKRKHKKGTGIIKKKIGEDACADQLLKGGGKKNKHVENFPKRKRISQKAQISHGNFESKRKESPHSIKGDSAKKSCGKGGREDVKKPDKRDLTVFKI